MTKGFTLIEVLAAMFIMLIGVLGVFSLISRTVTFNSSVNSQLVASYLAQEGLELVRNIRDTNFLKIHKGAGGNWTDDIIACDPPYDPPCVVDREADYIETALGVSQGRFLKISGGLYSYTAGDDTIFKRNISIVQSSADALSVSVDVSWLDKENTRTVRGATELYNWLTPAP